VAGLLQGWGASLDERSLTADALRRLLSRLRGEEELTRTWDDAARVYLAVAAVNHGLGDLDPDHRKLRGMAAAIKALGAELEAAFPPGADSIYDTPRRYDPAKAAALLRAIRPGP
jgi:hypothetical protein